MSESMDELMAMYGIDGNPPESTRHADRLVELESSLSHVRSAQDALRNRQALVALCQLAKAERSIEKIVETERGCSQK